MRLRGLLLERVAQHHGACLPLVAHVQDVGPFFDEDQEHAHHAVADGVEVGVVPARAGVGADELGAHDGEEKDDDGQERDKVDQHRAHLGEEDAQVLPRRPVMQPQPQAPRARQRVQHLRDGRGEGEAHGSDIEQLAHGGRHHHKHVQLPPQTGVDLAEQPRVYGPEVEQMHRRG